MLKKLLKYEFKATGRTYGALYLAVVIASLLLGLWIGLDNNFAGDAAYVLAIVLILLYTAAMIALAAVTIVTVIQRFYRNLLGGEGYLMHTLPVSSGALIASKLIAAAVWGVCSAAVGCASVAIIYLSAAVGSGNKFGLDTGEFNVLMADMERDVGISLYNFSAALALMLLAAGVCMILRTYAACMIGHQVPSHPALTGILAFFALTAAQNRLEIWLTDIINALTGGMAAAMSAGSLVWLSTALYIIMSAVFSAVYFLLTAWFMDNRLNLE